MPSLAELLGLAPPFDPNDHYSPSRSAPRKSDSQASVLTRLRGILGDTFEAQAPRGILGPVPR
jgi:hypothetical protein